MKSLHTVYSSNLTEEFSKLLEVRLRAAMDLACFCSEQDSTASWDVLEVDPSLMASDERQWIY